MLFWFADLGEFGGETPGGEGFVGTVLAEAAGGGGIGGGVPAEPVKRILRCERKVVGV